MFESRDEAQLKPNSQMWTESEAFQLLRCSTSHVRHLRLTRQLGCYPGRPGLSQADLEVYVAAVKIIRVRMPGTAKGYAVVPSLRQGGGPTRYGRLPFDPPADRAKVRLQHRHPPEGRCFRIGAWTFCGMLHATVSRVGTLIGGRRATASSSQAAWTRARAASNISAVPLRDPPLASC